VFADTVTTASRGQIVVERHRSTAAVAAEWDALADRCDASPFLRRGWFDEWIGAFDPSARLLVLAARADGRLTGVLVLVRGHATLSAAANWHTPVYGALTEDEAAARALAAAVLCERGSRADLTMLDTADPLLHELRAAASAHGRSLIERSTASQPYVDLSGGFESYCAGLPRKHRKEIGRLRRRLEAEGELTVHFDDGSERLDELLAEGFAIEGSGWKTENGSAIDSRPETLGFYTGIARWAAANGWLRLAFLRLDGRALAFDMCIEAGAVVSVLKGGFDREYSRFGPGVVLTYESLARAFANGLESFEFLGTADAYKLVWTDSVRDRRRLQVFSRSPLGHAQLAAWRYGRPLAKQVAARVGRG
jgi:CelD/BcsL family acetyltransferase involved in cellulose biosynthesis